MQKPIILFLISLILLNCQTTKQYEKIVVSDTTKFVIIDTTRLIIRDTFSVINRIDSIYYDTLYSFVDSVIVREVIKSIETNTKTTFSYDTSLIIEKNKLLKIGLNYDGKHLTINHDMKQLIEGEVRREKVGNVAETSWVPSLWIQIGIAALVGGILLIYILKKIYNGLGNVFNSSAKK